MQRKLVGIISIGLDVKGQLLIIYSAFVKHLTKNGNTRDGVYQLFIDFKKDSDSVRRKVLYTVPIESGIPLKLAKLIRMCLNETYSRIRA